MGRQKDVAQAGDVILVLNGEASSADLRKNTRQESGQTPVEKTRGRHKSKNEIAGKN
jgi:hypothetical protein